MDRKSALESHEEKMSPVKKSQKDAPPATAPSRRLKSSTPEMQPPTSPVKPAVPLPNGHDIAARAYELFMERGGQHGNDWEDWFNAEQQLIGRD